MALDWNDLRIGLAIARSGSLSGAAMALGVTHTTVGRRLTALEAELGTTLFRRSTQGLTPTSAGEALAARASEIEARVERLRDATSLNAGAPSGVVRLAGEGWAIDRLICAGLQDLLAAYPLIELRTLGGRNRVSLWRGEPGLGLWMHEDTQDGCFALKLGVPPLAVYAPCAGTPADDAWIALHDEETGRDDRTRALERLRRAGAGVPLTALDYVTVREAIAAGAGRGVLPVVLGAADPRLVQAGPAPEGSARPLYLHLHPDTLDTPRIQTVSAWIRRCFAVAFGAVDGGARP